MKFHWGHGITLFILIFLGFATWFIVFAFNQSQDLVENDYYEKGANYSRQMEIFKRSALYTDSIQMLNNRSGKVLIVCTGIKNLTDFIGISFIRPSDKNLDLHFQSPPTDTIRIPLEKFATGKYLVKIAWTMHKQEYNWNSELMITK